MQKHRKPTKPITEEEAKAYIDHYHELYECIERKIKTNHTEIPEGEKKEFLGKEHNAYVFTKKEILNLFGTNEEGHTDEFLLIVKGAHTQEHHDDGHPAGSETVVLMSVKEEGDAFLPSNTSTGINEFPWLGNVNAEVNEGKLVIKKILDKE